MDATRKASQIIPDLIADTAEEREPFRFGTLESCGVFEIAVDHSGLAGKQRAALFGVVTYGQNIIELLAREFVHALGSLSRNIDAQFAHGGNRLGPDLARFRPSAKRLKLFTCIVA